MHWGFPYAISVTHVYLCIIFSNWMPYTEHLVVMVLEATSPELGASIVWLWWGPSSRLWTNDFCLEHSRKFIRALSGSFYVGTNSWPNYPPVMKSLIPRTQNLLCVPWIISSFQVRKAGDDGHEAGSCSWVLEKHWRVPDWGWGVRSRELKNWLDVRVCGVSAGMRDGEEFSHFSAYFS